MASDLADRIREAVEARKALAEFAATESGGAQWRIGPQKRCECCDSVIGPGGYEIIATDDRLTPFIAANDPATVLRHCAEDLDVLVRHNSTPTYCPGCNRHPLGPACTEVLSMARRYGIEAP